MSDSAGADLDVSDESWSTRGLPRRLGRYELLAEVGAGGMASVYLARTTGPGRFHKWVAVKRVHPHLGRDKKFVEMFLDEARLAAAIQHPNVVQVFDLGEEDGEYFLAMEYLEGEHLGALASNLFSKRKQRFPIPLAARVLAAAAHGLHQAHEARDENGDSFGLVHRDVSPHNIFVSYGGDVKVMDFGVAKAAGRITSTETGGRKGKLAYMSPEQLLNEGVDRRTDIFALGIVLWEVTVGRRLFRGETDAQTISRILSGQVPTPSSLDPSYPLDLEEIVMKALARDPAARFVTAQAMGSELEQFDKRYSTAPGSLGVAGLMADLFADRIEQKRQMLRAARTVTTSPTSGMTPTGTPSGVAMPAIEIGSTEVTPPPSDKEVSRVSATRAAQAPEARPPSRAIWAVALLTPLVLVIGFVTMWVGRAPEAPTAPPPSAAAPPTTAAISAPPETPPPSAVAPPASVVSAPAAPPPSAVEAGEAPATTTHRAGAHAPARTDHAAPREAPVVPPPPSRPAATTAAAATTNIQVLALGAWAHVRIDGREVGQTPYNGQVAVGSHTIELATEDGRTFSERRVAAEGALLRVTHRFE